MKKFLKTMALMLLAAVIGLALGVGAIALDWSDNAVICVIFAGSILSDLVLGVFDVSERKSARHQSLKDAARLGQAA